MKHYILLAAVSILAACSQQKAAEPAASESAAATAEAAPAPSPTAGTYDVSMADGTKGVSILNADGTYEDQDAGGKTTVKGTWAVKDGKTCFTPEGKAEECFAESARAADGSFTATDAKGATVQVTPRAK
jgi:hypothetical protein